ncbi:hypothetical protein PENANT_c022G08427 [Penicillium antarcticum]|uniref:Uncharacterized protein n=1 Tax=Penicillium antarcticum TaxID=416450 RepID=A0A1V6Q0W0_9EURO|nr:hypothetical protein PENANT_c022G08427 [Penicillium antarcticum]
MSMLPDWPKYLHPDLTTRGTKTPWQAISSDRNLSSESKPSSEHGGRHGMVAGSVS